MECLFFFFFSIQDCLLTGCSLGDINPFTLVLMTLYPSFLVLLGQHSVYTFLLMFWFIFTINRIKTLMSGLFTLLLQHLSSFTFLSSHHYMTTQPSFPERADVAS